MSTLAKNGLKLLHAHKSSKKDKEPKGSHKHTIPSFDKKTQQVEQGRHGKITAESSSKDVEYYMSLGISAADAKRLQKVKSMALKFDGRRGIRGLRFWQCFNPIALIKRFGLIAFIAFFFPAVGDVIDLPLALLLVLRASRISGGLDRSTTSKMLLNVAIEFGLDLTPYLGPVVGYFFKSNKKNSALLEKVLIKRAQKARSQRKDQKSQHDDYELAAYHNTPPRRPKRHENGHERSKSSHSDVRQPHVQEQPIRPESNGWRNKAGNLTGRKKSSHRGGAAPQASKRSEYRGDVGSQGGRFITARDL